MENYHFNALCCSSEDKEINQLFAAYTERMRNESGMKFQTVLFQYPQADFEGVISLENEISAEDE